MSSGPLSGASDTTRLIHVATGQGPLCRTVGPPIQRGSTVLLPDAAAIYDEGGCVTYGRGGLSAQTALKEALAAMEGAAGVTLYPSGLAAVTGALLALLSAGDEVLVVDTVYKPVRRFCDKVLARYGVKVTYYDACAAPEALVASASPAVRLILLESPGSLTFEMQDVPRIAALARERGILTAIDNTWGAGFLFRPLEHGVDISLQALTKYVGGHSDVFMGSAAARDPKLVRALEDGIVNVGWSVSGDDAYLMLRGLRTLPMRLAAHGEAGLKVATWLQTQPEVGSLLHPAMPGCPGHDIWARDYTGTCGLFAFALKPAPRSAVDALLNTLQIFGLGFSWGGFESLAIPCDPQLAQRRLPRDYGGPLVRLHIGLESPDDLIADLRRGLDAYAKLAG
jgi:cystathionine beta-lyase, bacterial